MVQAATSAPLIERSIERATGIVYNITGGSDLTLQEVNRWVLCGFEFGFRLEPQEYPSVDLTQPAGLWHVVSSMGWRCMQQGPRPIQSLSASGWHANVSSDVSLCSGIAQWVDFTHCKVKNLLLETLLFVPASDNLAWELHCIAAGQLACIARAGPLGAA
jgi:FtsZ family, C-terminal domain